MASLFFLVVVFGFVVAASSVGPALPGEAACLTLPVQ
jgi:hypothetical protein